MKKKVVWFLICAAIFAPIGFKLSIWRLSDGFSVKSIHSDLSFSPYREVPSLSQEEKKTIDAILSEQFYYLGKGSQCYVFESEDKKYVLKFFKHHRYRLPTLANHLSLPPFLAEIQKRRADEKREKLDRLFESCKLAYEKLHDESGLVYLHLNKTSSLKKKVVVYDKLKRPYSIEIDDYEFIIQRKATLVYPYLSTLIKKGETEKAYASLLGIKKLLMTRFEKGIADSDPVIGKNAGFLSDQPIYLDVGQFSESGAIQNPNIYKKELVQVTRRLVGWLYEKSPELAQRFNSSLGDV